MKKWGKITLIISAVILLAAGGTLLAFKHQQQVQAEQLKLTQKNQARQAKTQAARHQQKLAAQAVTTAYRSQATADISAAEKAIQRVTGLDRINLTTKLTTLKNLLAQTKAATTAVSQAEKTQQAADIKTAQQQLQLLVDPLQQKSRTADQRRLDQISVGNADPTDVATDQPTTTTDNDGTDQTNTDAYQATAGSDTTNNTNSQGWWQATTDNNYSNGAANNSYNSYGDGTSNYQTPSQNNTWNSGQVTDTTSNNGTTTESTDNTAANTTTTPSSSVDQTAGSEGADENIQP